MSRASQFRPRDQSILGLWILVSALTVFAIAPLTYPGFFQVHSGFLAPFKASNPDNVSEWAYGVEPLRAEGRLPYLLAWPFVQISKSGVVGIRWGYALAFILAALSAFTWADRWLGKRGGVLAAVIYTYLPWHLGTVYVRGAYAESWLWVFWPVVLWGIDQGVDWLVAGTREQLGKRLCQLAGPGAGLLALGASFWTMPGLAVAFCPLVVAYALVRLTYRRRLLWAIVGLVATIGATIPVARTRPAPAPTLPDHLLYPFQLLSAPPGSGQAQSLGAPHVVGMSQATPASFQLGVAAVGLAIVAIALWATSWAHRRPGAGHQTLELAESVAAGQDSRGQSPSPTSMLAFWTVCLLVIALAVLQPAALLWRLTGWDALLSQPWQLLGLACLPLAFLGGSVPRLDGLLARPPAWAGLLALVILGSYSDLAPRFTQVDPGPRPVGLFLPRQETSPHIALLNATIEAPSPMTPTLTVELTWQAAAPVAEDYTIFVHLLAPGTGDLDTRIAQQDVRPCQGECPTDAWRPGDLIVTRHQLELPEGASIEPGTGPLRLAIGLYLLETGDRAPVLGRDDEMVILDVR